MALALGSSANRLRVGANTATRVYKGSTAFWDSDAAAYIAAVEAADQQPLELGVCAAYHNFVLGCKADGIWDAIKASCILAGARTLTGALVPLKGSAPTNNGPFVSDDYNRETGLVGNGSTKYLDSNRTNDDDPQNSQHLSVYLSSITAVNKVHVGAGGSGTGTSAMGVSITPTTAFQNNRNSAFNVAGTLAIGLYAMSRSTSSAYVTRCNGNSTTLSRTSESPSSGNLFVFARENGSGSADLFLGDRLAFYSIGESLDLAKLDTRVSALIAAIGAAI